MPQIKTSQIGGVASNPANDVHNILLQEGNGNKDLGQNLTMKTSDLVKVLKDIIDPSIKITEDHEKKILDAQKFFNEYADDLNALYGALKNNTESVTTKDPMTGKKYPTGPELAKDLLSRIEKMNVSASLNKVFNMVRFSASKKDRAREEKDKKKTRGNPFRVLMGKVGKLLDHGVDKNDIVRYISKLKYWNKETIERAVDIVRDYNKKLQQDKGDTKKTADTIDLDKLVKTKEEVEKKTKDIKDTVQKIDDTEKSKREASIKTAAVDYDKKPNFQKRSTGELIMRACFLMDLQDYSKTTKQGDFKDAADKKGVKEELKEIRAALTDRGFDKDELSMLGLGD